MELSNANLRRALRWAFWPALIVLALNIENLAGKLGIDSLLADNAGPAVSTVWRAILSAWAHIPAILIVGWTLELWLVRLLRRG